jgi:hypothetical protein
MGKAYLFIKVTIIFKYICHLQDTVNVRKTMARKVIIAHGWDGHPQEGWFPWLKSTLVEVMAARVCLLP